MKILSFGSANIDLVYSLNHIVRVGESEIADSYNTFAGGKGLNQAISLAKAGADAYFAGCIGADGEILIKALTENGVNTDFIKRSDNKNGHALIQVSAKGENAIFVYPGTNGEIDAHYISYVFDHFEKGDYCLIQNEISNTELIIKAANEKGVKICFNPSPINENIAKIDLNLIDILILNEVEAEDITGQKDKEKALLWFKEKYPDLEIMLTLGKNGAVYSYKETRVHHPIFDVEVKDTTAAGDTFTGYFLVGLSKGNSIENVLKTASMASAIAVSREGAAPSIPKREEVIKALKAYGV